MPAPPSPTYQACGITIASALDLPGLARTDAPPDVTVRRGPVETPDAFAPTGIAAVPGPDADVLAWYGRARLRISADALVADGDDDRFLCQCIVGPGLGVLLHRRGRLALHGSAVDVGGRAVVFLGQKGAGKSTTAAALLDRGHALLTDDLVAIGHDAAGRPTVLPGPSQMKLWPASAEAVGLGDAIEPFLDGLPKGVYYGARRAEAAVPVAAVCALAWGDAVGVEPLGGAEGFGEVFGHVYAPRFLGAPASASLLAPCTALLRAAPPVRLTRPQTLTHLEEVARRVEALASRA